MTLPTPDDYLAEYIRRFGGNLFSSLEELLVSPDGFGLETATPLQRAICRVAEGRPLGDLGDHPHVMAGFGFTEPIEQLPWPKRLQIRAGIRTFKSLFTAVAAVYVSQKLDDSNLKVGEIPRLPIISLKMDLAHVIMRHLVGTLMARPILRQLLVDDPTSDTVKLRMPSGRTMEVKVVAGTRAGAAVVSYWLAGLIFDEAPRMLGAAEGVVNLDETRAAALGRILPGGQIFEIGSPYQPYGPFYESDMANFGNPSEDVCVVYGQANWLNPIWWTKERAEKLKVEDPMAYRTDFLAQYASPEESAFSQATLDEIIREGDLFIPPEEGREYAAAIDPATRGNAWTLVIAARLPRPDPFNPDELVLKKVVVRHQEWVGSPTEPLSPRKVFQEMVPILRLYGLDWVYTDQYSADAYVDIAEDFGLGLLVEEWTAQNKKALFGELVAEARLGLCELPPDPVFRKDFTMVKKRPVAGSISEVRYVLPHTPDGRHCDYVPPTARVFSYWVSGTIINVPKTEEERLNREAAKRKELASEKLDNPDAWYEWEGY